MDDVNVDAKEVFRRVEVLTAPVRRRRWSAEEKARIVEESLIPGARVSDVARRWQICSQQVFSWRREARGTVMTTPCLAADPSMPGFVPIMAEAEASPTTTAPTVSSGSTVIGKRWSATLLPALSRK